MLIYLNNQQNRKEHPNENFARELMELFTLGRGNYTESDVKEAARAFTGWAFDRETGAFTFREKNHDDGEKNIFNRKGNFGGEDVINMIMSNKQTAHFIARKMYKYYVNENVNEAHVKELGEFYYMSQYNTGALVKKIFSSTWFFSPENIGCNIKTPVELIVGMSRLFDIKYKKYDGLFKLQNLLGQTLFYPPNVAGWPGGKNYIDTSTLLLRLKFPSVILSMLSAPQPVPENETEQPPEEKAVENSDAPVVNWDKIIMDYGKLEFDFLLKALLAKMPPKGITEKLKNDTALSRKDMLIKIVSLPEYSLV
jgi:uncharacterized protein (DUF1800 family)